MSASSGKVLGGLRFPLLPGHEAAGIVESVGDPNSSFKVNLNACFLMNEIIFSNHFQRSEIMLFRFFCLR